MGKVIHLDGNASLQNQLDNLNNNEKLVTYFEVVAGTSSGNQVTVPTNGEIVLDKFGSSKDAILSTVDGNSNVTWESPRDASGQIVTTSMDANGTYVFSSTPVDVNVAVIYTFKIKQEFWSDVNLDFVINENELNDTQLPTNYEVIEVESDWQDVGGKNYLESKVYLISSNGTLTKPFDTSGITGNCYLIFRNITTYSGTGALFQGSLTGSLEVNDCGVFNLSSQPIFDITGTGGVSNLLIFRRSGFAGFSSTGCIKNVGGSVSLGRVQFIDSGEGLITKDCGALNFDYDIVNSVSNNTPQLVLDGTFGDIIIKGGNLNLNAGESFIQISPDIVLSKALVADVPYSSFSGAEFFASPNTGNNTAYADNGSGGSRVTSAAHGLTIEQKIVISNTTNYNGTFELTVIDANTYDINTPFVANDATGDFTTGDSNVFLDDIRFNFRDNGDQVNSNEVLEMSVASSFVVPIAAPGVPVEAQGGVGDWMQIISRRGDFEADGNGRFRYIGLIEKEFIVSGTINLEPNAGGQKLLAAYIMKNGVVVTSSRSSNESGREMGLNPYGIITLQTGNYISLAVENSDDDIDILINSGTISAISNK